MSPTDASGAATCPVCGGARADAVLSEAPDPLTGEAFSIWRCEECRVAFTSPRPANLEPYYPARYRAYGPLVRGVLETFYRARVRRWIAGRKPGAALEIGCGPGIMLAALARAGWRPTGIERNPAMAEAARRASGAEIHSCTVDALSLDRRFDLILLFNVLEHVGDPVGVLKACAARLAAGGRLIVSVPNFASWQARFGGGLWLHLDPPRHLVHFDVATLDATLARAGLRRVDRSFVSWEHDPYGWIDTAAGRATQRHNPITRYLMGIDRFDATVAASMAIAGFAMVPALALTLASWAAGRGALMEVTAIAEGGHRRG